jgi:hypothetical protein
MSANTLLLLTTRGYLLRTIKPQKQWAHGSLLAHLVVQADVVA